MMGKSVVASISCALAGCAKHDADNSSATATANGNEAADTADGATDLAGADNASNA